jgi:hypothetical protein
MEIPSMYPHARRILLPAAIAALAASASARAQAVTPTPASLPIPSDSTAAMIPAGHVVGPVIVDSADVMEEMYRRADSVALAVPERLTHDVDTLSHALTDGLVGDAARLRAIYRWVTENIAYDVVAMHSANRARLQTPETVLRRRMAVCDGFSFTLGTLAARAGMEATLVEGRAKGLGVAEGETGGRHSWVAVKVDGEWKLIDATWGAGDIIDGRFVRHVRDFYFLADPEKLIWSHLPNTSRWQLLPRPLSDDEFRRQPMLPRDFFDLGFTASSLRDAAAAPGFTGFVGAFPLAGRTVTVVDAPLARDLTAGTEYGVTVDAPGADSVMIVSGRRWTKLPRDGQRFTGRFTPAAGDTPVVLVRYNTEPQAHVVLQYATVAADDRRR